MVTALAIALAACSDGQAAPSAPTAPGPSPTTTAVPVTTSTSTTVSTAPPTTEDPEIAAVREAHLAYLAMFEVVGDPPDPDHPELARVATGDAYDRLRANLAQDRLAGNRMVGLADSRIESIHIEAATATVVNCLLDGLAVLNPTGNTIVAADESRYRVRTHLALADGHWRVASLLVPAEPESCDA